MQTFRDIAHLMQHFRVTLPDAGKWRLVDQRLGEITGLPRLRGRVVATNGILCLIHEPVSDELFEGHFEWFTKDTQHHPTITKKLRQDVQRRADQIAQRYL